jgi:hypothetical protein
MHRTRKRPELTKFLLCLIILLVLVLVLFLVIVLYSDVVDKLGHVELSTASVINI